MPKNQCHRHEERSSISSRALQDQLEYIADLLLELKEMALSHKLITLAGILDLAGAEARQRAKDHA